MKRLPHSFTLIELLVVIAIIAILIALLFPIFGIVEKKPTAPSAKATFIRSRSRLLNGLANWG